MLSRGKGGYLHLTDAVEGWLVPGRNPFALYLYMEEVDALAAAFGSEAVGKNGPDASLGNVRVVSPTRMTH